MTIVAQVLELHRQNIPVPEIAAACLTSFQRIEQIIRDFAFPAGVERVPPRHRSAYPRQTTRSPRRRGPPLPDASSTNTSSRSENEGTFGDQCLCWLPNLRCYSRRLARDHAAAQDLIQDTLVLALKNQHRFMPGTNLCAWLITIMRNRHINDVRDAVSASKLVDLIQPPAMVGGDQEIAVEIQELRHALQRLPEHKREILLLACDRGLSYDEIADVMNIPLGTVRSRIARSRLLLSRMLDREDRRMR